MNLYIFVCLYKCIYIHIYVCVYIYIYIYIPIGVSNARYSWRAVYTQQSDVVLNCCYYLEIFQIVFFSFVRSLFFVSTNQPTNEPPLFMMFSKLNRLEIKTKQISSKTTKININNSYLYSLKVNTPAQLFTQRQKI